MGSMARDINVQIVTSAFGPEDVEIARVEGHERIGQLYQFDIEIVSKSASGYDVEAMTGVPAAMVFVEEGAAIRQIDGLIVQVTEGLDELSSHPSYRLRLVPRAHVLTLIRTQEVFLDCTVVDVIEKKLKLCELDHELLLSGDYPEREFIVQYAETDLAFISRLCEHVGISFYHARDDDRVKLVFTDDNRFHRLAEERHEVPFVPRGEHLDIYDLDRESNMIPRVYVVSDYNYRTPLVDLKAMCESPVGAGGGVVEHGAHFKTTAQGEVLAAIRREAAECRRVQLRGKTDRADLGAGAMFALTDHPQFAESDLLVTEAHHELRQVAGGTSSGDLSYVNRFVAVSSATSFRPERLTPRPRMQGIVNGIVLARPGTDGTQPWLDGEGRYTVRILFDTASHEEKASHAMRMAQAHSGPGYGTHFPLRPGVEVLMAFIDGDVDRPIIVGSVPNPVTPSPVVENESLHHRIQTATGVKLEFEDGR